MNRTLASPTTSQLVPTQDNVHWLDRRELPLPTEEFSGTGYSCFAPIHYEPGYAYPLIVWLHGFQSSEEELPQVMPLISTRNFVGIAPRGTSRVKNVSRAYTWEESTAGIAEAGERVDECISLARDRFNVNPERIFVAGHSAGGTMALRLGLEFPERFAGAISLGGRVPRGSRLLKNLNRIRDQKLPLLLSVSPTEGVYTMEQAMSDLRFLHSAGASLSLRLYPAGDELTKVMFTDMHHWVMEQFCSANAAVAS